MCFSFYIQPKPRPHAMTQKCRKRRAAAATETMKFYLVFACELQLHIAAQQLITPAYKRSFQHDEMCGDTTISTCAAVVQA